MQPSKAKILTLALAALMVLGTLDAASARKKKVRAKPQPTASENEPRHVPGQLVPVDRDGTPIIMQGYRSRAITRDKEPNEAKEPVQRADRPVKIPRGSSTYIPPPSPSPYSSSNPPAALTQPAPAPYQPPKITTFSDKVNDAIHAYPLQKGIGNNPTDQQQFIRQRVNQ